jgi:O-acetyl-ADP-ribose deacetylase (regulator of RNase III)
MNGKKKDFSNQQVIKEAVQKCLELAETAIPGTDPRSIGFPALGCGNLHYPPDVVAECMFDATLEYGNQHPSSLVADVFFILHKKDKENHKVEKLI